MMFLSGMFVWLLIVTSPGQPRVVAYLDSRVECEASAERKFKKAKPVHTGKCIRVMMPLAPV